MSSRYKIIVGCNSIRILNYDENANPQLEKNFMIWNQTKHKLEPFAMHYDEEKKMLILPRGIDLYYVQRVLQVPSTELIWEDPNEFETFDNIRMRNEYHPRDDRQKKALRFISFVIMLGVIAFGVVTYIFDLVNCIRLNAGWGSYLDGINTYLLPAPVLFFGYLYFFGAPASK